MSKALILVPFYYPQYIDEETGSARLFFAGHIAGSHDLNGDQSNFRDDPLTHYTYFLPKTDTS